MPASTVLTSCECGVSSPIFRIASLNSSRSSAFLIDSIFAPISSTPYLSRMPASARSIDEVQTGLPADGGEQRVRALRRITSSAKARLSGST